MVAKPWKCALAVGMGVVLLLAVGCAKQNATNETTSPAASTTPAATDSGSAQAAQPTQGNTNVKCANQNGSDVDNVVLTLKNGQKRTYPGTYCGIIWGQAASGQIPDNKTGQPSLTTGVCVWMGDHWECGPTLQSGLADSAAKAGVKK
jgi:hypothetical protein